MEKELRVIISGGGTGGHIFPAVSIANAIKAMRPDAKILFVGALGRMEMQRVDQGHASGCEDPFCRCTWTNGDAAGASSRL